MPIKVTMKERDYSKDLLSRLKMLKKTDVLVGIPESDNAREGDTITNAQLAFIHTHGVRSREMRTEMDASISGGAAYPEAHQMYLHAHGSAMYSIPPRPIIEPAIEAEDNKERISRELAQAAKSALQGDMGNMSIHLHRAGMAGQNAARKWFTDARNGWPRNAPSTIKRKGSDKPLIDTGALRKAITYVVRGDTGGIL